MVGTRIRSRLLMASGAAAVVTLTLSLTSPFASAAPGHADRAA